MKTSKFNLRKHFRTAFYDDARGCWNNLTRSWNNCYKLKSDQGKTAQEAWDGCLKEYQEANSKGKWLENYGADQDSGPKPRFDAKTPAVQAKK